MLHFKLLPVCLTFYFFTDISAFKFSCSFHNSEPLGEDYAIHDSKDYEWPNNEVPYVFDENTFIEDQKAIKEQMDIIETNVPCIKFIEKSKGNVPQQHLKIKIYNQKSCRQTSWNTYWSLGGNVNNYYSPRIDLISGTRLADCDDERYKKASGLWIIHELMHVFGIEHTQKRSARDDYIEVYDRCIKNGSVNHDQYEKLINYPDISFREEVPYRCDSVMHYEPETLSIDKYNCPTMKNKTTDCVFGGEEVLPEDWTMLRKQIGCTAGTSCNVRSGGYFPSSSNIGKFLSSDWQDCAHQCFMHPQCKFWSYEQLRDCYLKSESADSGWVPGDYWKSGNKACGDSAIRSPNKTPTRDTGCSHTNIWIDETCDRLAKGGHCQAPIKFRRDRVVNQVCAKSCFCGNTPVNGEWAPWNLVGSCSKSCGSGYQERQRTCDAPPPSNGGAPCTGPDWDQVVCNTQPCPGGCPYKNYHDYCDYYARARSGNCIGWWMKKNCAKSCGC